MVVRSVIAFLWLVTIGLLAAAMRLPRSLYLYIHDFYFVVPRPFVMGLILAVLVLPLVGDDGKADAAIAHR